MTIPVFLLDDLSAWACNNPGESKIYAQGYIPGLVGNVQDPELAAAAFIARQLFEAGLVELVQRKHAPFEYDYIMIAKREPQKPGWNWWTKPVRIKRHVRSNSRPN